jgi:hypothetical protein
VSEGEGELMPMRVEVQFGDKPGDTAVLLLAAAETLGLEQSVVKTGTGVFIVPPEVAEEAGLGPSSGEQEKEEPEPKSEPETPKRRPATKKSAKKK